MSPSSSSSSALLLLPPGLVELHVGSFLDAASLSRLSRTCRELQSELRLSPLWAALVAARFGLTDLPNARDLRWMAVFAAASRDARALATADDDAVALKLFASRSEWLSAREAAVRQELVLMQGLRRFPASVALVALYARALRAGIHANTSSGAVAVRTATPTLAPPAWGLAL